MNVPIKKSVSRRNFLQDTSVTLVGIGVGLSGLSSLSSCSNTKKTAIASSLPVTGFEQKPLPYQYDALENIIDAATMEIHYSKHAAAYAKNLREAAAAENVQMDKPVEDLFPVISKYSAKMRNNAGGHYNHELFWQCMKPKESTQAPGYMPKPSGTLLNAIERDFGSFDNCKNQFSDAAKNRFGSGWAWLYADNSKTLKIGSTPNQDNPLMNISDIKGYPLLALDVWEHAYYLKYQNKRADYVNNWWAIVNWDYVQQRFLKI